MGILKNSSIKKKPKKSTRLPSGDKKKKSEQKILISFKYGADA